MFHIVLQMWVLQNVCDFVSSCSISQNFVSSCSISQKWSWARFCNFHFSKFCKYAFRFASFARFSQLAVCWWNLSLRMIHDLTSLMVSVTISVEDSDVCFKWWSNVLPVTVSWSKVWYKMHFILSQISRAQDASWPLLGHCHRLRPALRLRPPSHWG